MTYFVACTGEGAKLCKMLADSFGDAAKAYAADRHAGRHGLEPTGKIQSWCAGIWDSADEIVFIGAAGIAVRTIAPLIKSKTTDPAVVVTDEKGRFAVSLLSGHIGGGNELAEKIAKLTGGTPVITTATDVNNKFAVDVFARKNGLYITSIQKAKEISAAILDGKRIGFLTDLKISGELPEELSAQVQKLNCEVGYVSKAANSLLLIPQNICLGIGCKRGTPEADICAAVNSFLSACCLPMEAVCRFASIDIKSDELGLMRYVKSVNRSITFYSADELNALDGNFSYSGFVKARTGIDCVCERAAVRGADGGALLTEKYVYNGVTLAAGEIGVTLKFGKGTD